VGRFKSVGVGPVLHIGSWARKRLSGRDERAAMVTSHGGVSGGLSIADALQEFESRGYLGQFVIRPGGSVECSVCGERQNPRTIPLEAMRRLEGASDPADMVFIGALRCPHCGARGTAVVPYGPLATPDSAHVLRELSDKRPSATLSDRYDDKSLIHDSGWLHGPDG